jgi:membrane fusion protein (multidrug efflux system)
MIVRTRFVRRRLDQVLAVPLYAVIDREGQKYLFIRKGETARRQQVALGEILNGEVIIREGLAAGDEVVVRGHQLLADGAPIRSGEKL